MIALNEVPSGSRPPFLSNLKAAMPSLRAGFLTHASSNALTMVVDSGI